MTRLLLLVSAAALVGTAAGTAFLRARARAWGLMDVPNERSLHSSPTPRGGGIVIVAAVIMGLLAMTIPGTLPAAPVVVFAAAALLVATVGWWDDRHSLSPAFRLVTHLAAAGVAVAFWGSFDAVDLPGAGILPLAATLATAATVIWIAGLLNAYNFMDGMDGLAAGQAVVAGIMWVLLCGSSVPTVTTAAAVVAAACAGFLWHNWSPARIFMGDVGSGFLGFTFAVLPLIAYADTGDARYPVAGVLIMAPFVFDTGYTFLRRLVRGEKVTEAHRTHLYQRLVLGGWSHAAGTTLYLGLALLSGGAAVAWMRGGEPWIILAPLAAVFAVPALLARRIARADT